MSAARAWQLRQQGTRDAPDSQDTWFALERRCAVALRSAASSAAIMLRSADAVRVLSAATRGVTVAGSAATGSLAGDGVSALVLPALGEAYTLPVAAVSAADVVVVGLESESIVDDVTAVREALVAWLPGRAVALGARMRMPAVAVGGSVVVLHVLEMHGAAAVGVCGVVTRVRLASRAEVMLQGLSHKKNTRENTHEETHKPPPTVAGLDDALAALCRMLQLPFQRAGGLAQLGLECPRGMLLHGPPGCGKTLLVRAAAAEADAALVSVSHRTRPDMQPRCQAPSQCGRDCGLHDANNPRFPHHCFFLSFPSPLGQRT